MLIPMLGALYGSIDRALEHRRRYAKAEVAAKLEEAGFELEQLAPLNVLGIAGWLLNSRILRRTSVPGIQARINDLLTPLLRLEHKLRPPIGMSLLAVGRKAAAQPNQRA